MRLAGLTEKARELLDFQQMGLFFSLDLLGYALMSLAAFFVGLTVEPKDKPSKWLRALLMIHGVFFIEKNRTEDITLSELAGASLFSPWYSYRLFREYIGLTPTEYIRKYRLTQAARRLRTGKVKVIDAAYDAGFSNADTFTRAFYREFGLNPVDYMKHPVPVTFFIPYGAKYRELRKENIDVSNIQTVFVQIIRKPERLRVTPVGPVFILGVELTMYIVYCAVPLAVLTIPAALFWHVRLRGSLLRFLGSRARCRRSSAYSR